MSDNPGAYDEDKAIEAIDDYSVCREIDKLIEESSDYRKKFEQDWKEYEAFYDGRHWANATEKKPKINYTFSIIEYEVPILTDSRPGTDVIANQDENMDDAKVLKEAIDHVYNFNHVNLRVACGVREALKATNHYLYVDFDPDLENGMGQVTIKGLNWRYVYLDPSEGDLDDMAYVIIKKPVKVNLLRRQFPMYEDDIEPEDVEVDDMQESTMYELQDRYHGPRRQSTLGKFKPTDMAYLVEAWRKDYTMEPIPDEDTLATAQDELQQISQGIVPDVSRYHNHEQLAQILQAELSGLVSNMQLAEIQKQQAISGAQQALQVDPNNPNVQEHAMMVQQGADQQNAAQSEQSVVLQLLDDLIQQHLVMVEQNPTNMRPKFPHNLRLTIKVCDTVLYDGPSPVDDGKFPIAPIYCYKGDGQPYSTGEIKNILDQQKVMNEIYYEEYKGLRLVTNSGWIKDDTSNVDDTTLTNDPGIVVTKKQGTEVTRLPPGQVSPQLAEYQFRNSKTMEQISGITEATQGKRPSGITSGVAIEQLQDQAIGRIRLKSRCLEEYTMLRLGELTAARIIKYWTSSRILRNFSDDGRIQTIHFDPTRMDQLEYSVRMAPGSTIGISKEGILNASKEMVMGGLIDPTTFVMMNDLPYKNLILTKVQERDQLQQQAQALLQENEQLKLTLQQLAGGAPGNGQPKGPVPGAQS